MRGVALVFEGVEDEAGGDFRVEEGGLLGHALAGVRDIENTGDGDGVQEQSVARGAAAYIANGFGGVFREPEGAVVRHLRFLYAENVLEDDVIRDRVIEVAPGVGAGLREQPVDGLPVGN